MSAEMTARAWMHQPITAEEYDSWSEEQCAGVLFTGRVETTVPLTVDVYLDLRAG